LVFLVGIFDLYTIFGQNASKVVIIKAMAENQTMDSTKAVVVGATGAG
jgi:hypothetical protein